MARSSTQLHNVEMSTNKKRRERVAVAREICNFKAFSHQIRPMNTPFVFI